LHPGTERLTEDEEDKTGDRLTECLKKLKDYDRLLVKLRYFDGKSNEDIAEMTDKSSAAVRRRISRILKRLRDCLR
jgi:RNA polymerase sigma-70 factor (ECF subfamily)